MDAETSMREQTELRRQEQTSQSFGQRLQEKATQNNELIFEPLISDDKKALQPLPNREDLKS